VTRLFRLFYAWLPARPRAAGPDALASAAGPGAREWVLVAAAAGLAAGGFLAYYLPIYRAPHLFPAVPLALPGLARPVTLRWGELLWGIALTSLELLLLTCLNIAGVHAVGVATGFVDAGTRGRGRDALLGLGLEQKATGAARYGIDPFQGLNPAALFLFNAVLRLKGWLGNQLIRSLTRLLLGRLAVRSVLDFSGLPLYMAINAYAVRAVLREARVVILGRRVVRRFLAGVPAGPRPAAEAQLLYDTLQYVAVSKRDYHRNHYLLTRGLLARCGIPRQARHPLPPDYLARLRAAPERTLALCQAVVLLGFVLDGRVSHRERRRVRELNRAGAVRESPADVVRYARDLLRGDGVEAWLPAYLASAAGPRARGAGPAGARRPGGRTPAVPAPAAGVAAPGQKGRR
jgi:hypothetical protein